MCSHPENTDSEKNKTNISQSTLDRRQSKTLLTIDERRSKSLETEFSIVIFSPVGRQMAIKSSVSKDF